jgi:mono/diheme cytochrome c family protein
MRRTRPSRLTGNSVAVAIVAATLATSRPGHAEDEQDIDFGRDVRPVLASNCFKCHGPDAEARQAGLRLDTFDGATSPLPSGRIAIVPGRLDASAVIDRIRSHEDAVRMPPAEVGPRLTDDEIDVLTRWIKAGAVYEPHWAFIAPRRADAPAVEHSRGDRNEIDVFIRRSLDVHGLEAAGEADRAKLARRLSLDLIGLPPTAEQVRRFVADSRPDAHERLVDELLDSPHFGERWAKMWLDLARYADTKGYEKDQSRTIWRYRDWVIEAFNADMPFDQFTTEQLAGDLLPQPTVEQMIATAFHRNTMTNDEGGTDDEEFRVAAVVDRVNTTMQAWMGLTFGCAQCHTHKYDPITQREYYQVYAYFNQTQDFDQADERPTMLTPTTEQTAMLAALDARMTEQQAAIDRAVDSIEFVEPPVSKEDREYVWIGRRLPFGASAQVHPLAAEWPWTSDVGPAALPSARVTRSAGEGMTQHFFDNAVETLLVNEGDILVAWVWLDPNDTPDEIMLQFHSLRAGWSHRAYWGSNVIGFGADGSSQRRPMGELPAAGEWVKLTVAAAEVGLAAGDELNGWAFTQHGGTVLWAGGGVATAEGRDRHRVSFAAWIEWGRQRADMFEPAVAAALRAPEATRTSDDIAMLRRRFLADFHVPTMMAIEPLVESLDSLKAERVALERSIVTTPIMRDLEPGSRRTTRVLLKGSHLSPGEPVGEGVPAALHPLPANAMPNRLGLARWIVARENPLAARVFVNRVWEQLFGTGIVETVEDFGVQGAPPTHPELLDWLAVEFMDSGWSLKRLLRLITASSAYRRSSTVAGGSLAADRENRWFARAPRYRLDAEAVRDQALAVSGLLSRAMHGPPVYPPQPDGIWMMVYSDERWMTSEGSDRHRRGLYTFWRRTSPYPSMTTFDAGSREFCVTRRLRTNTPLQALVTLNDPVYVEAAQAFARRIITEGGASAQSKAEFAFFEALARRPDGRERAVLTDLYESEHEHYSTRPAEAIAMASDPLGPLPDGVDRAEAAAWTVVANVILNLDEFLTRR